MAIIELKKCLKKYEKDGNIIIAVNKITRVFEAGKLYVIIGASGAGKSTLLQCIGLLDKFTDGDLYINNQNIKHLTTNELADIRKKHIGFIFQNYYLSPNLNALQNIMLPLYLNKNLNKDKRIELSKDILKKVGLENRINHYPSELSGGEQQRVAIARALINNPDILLADEPTGNLDSKNEKVIMNILKKCSKDGKCVLVVSHSKVIQEYADELLIMKNGVLSRYE